MQIVEFDGESPDFFSDIEPQIAKLTEDADRIKSAKASMLLVLVQHLKASGSEPRAVGSLFLRNELLLMPAGKASDATIRISVDWYDHGPVDGDLPRMHYRVNVHPKDRKLSTDVRTRDVKEVEKVLLKIFRWTK